LLKIKEEFEKISKVDLGKEAVYTHWIRK